MYCDTQAIPVLQEIGIINEVRPAAQFTKNRKFVISF